MIETGELFTWERAFESFVFFASKIYPGKSSMLQAYKLEMRKLWLQMNQQLSWKGFVELEKKLRDRCMRRFSSNWSQSSDPTWSTSILQYLHSHPMNALEFNHEQNQQGDEYGKGHYHDDYHDKSDFQDVKDSQDEWDFRNVRD
jgi:hypothetical protein